MKATKRVTVDYENGISGFIYEVKKNRALFIMMLPPLIFLLINNYLPMFGVILAFQKFDSVKGILGSPLVGLTNFEFLFSSPTAFEITRNTILYNGVFILVDLIGAVTFAIILNEIKNKLLAKLYQSVMFFPYFLSMVVVSYLVYALLAADNGFLNKIVLPALGKEEIQWYLEPNYWPLILTIVHVWKGIGYGTIIYLAGITGIDGEFYEAAIIDGASKWQQIKTITIPLLKPLIVITTLMAVGQIFRADFGLFYQVTKNSGMLYSVTDVIDTYIYRGLAEGGKVEMSAAAGLYQSVVGFVLVLFSNWTVSKISNENRLF